MVLAHWTSASSSAKWTVSLSFHHHRYNFLTRITLNSRTNLPHPNNPCPSSSQCPRCPRGRPPPVHLHIRFLATHGHRRAVFYGFALHHAVGGLLFYSLFSCRPAPNAKRLSGPCHKLVRVDHLTCVLPCLPPNSGTGGHRGLGF